MQSNTHVSSSARPGDEIAMYALVYMYNCKHTHMRMHANVRSICACNAFRNYNYTIMHMKIAAQLHCGVIWQAIFTCTHVYELHAQHNP